jgi:peptidyl-dipeptidase A
MHRSSPLPYLAAALLVAAVTLVPLSAPRVAHAQPAGRSAIQERADRFLELMNASYQAIYTVAQRAQWDAATDVSPAHDAASEAAGKAQAAFLGNPAIITEAKALLEHAAELDPLTVRELQRVLINAAEGPMTNPALVTARIEAETKQASTMNGFVFHFDGKPITANQIDDQLVSLTDLAQRRALWEASKEIGPALRPGLEKLQGLRNGVARELGYHDYFALQVARHDMATDDMLRMHEAFLTELRPLYLQLYTWAKYELAKKYGQTVPKMIPAHWLPNRWSQEWNGMVASSSLDAAFKGHDAEWIAKTAESFWTGIGMEPLPESFWKDSDMYPVPAGSERRKNAHASCWHVDLDHDIRSLQSIEPNEQWFGTAHHELGHGHYDLCYARPEVPMLLRDGASPAFQEGMAGIGEMAARQTPYLESLGLLPKGRKADEIAPLLAQALANIPFMVWASGTMTHWEADLYAHDLPPDQWNARWWQYVGQFQGVAPPAPRGEEYCDAATKTHINDYPAYYFSYAIATVLQYQLHDYIARQILKQDPRRCSYAGQKEVGDFLAKIMRQGATHDWRTVLRGATGEELSTRAMVEYYRPLMTWLEKQNRGRRIGWE